MSVSSKVEHAFIDALSQTTEKGGMKLESLFVEVFALEKPAVNPMCGLVRNCAATLTELTLLSRRTDNLYVDGDLLKVISKVCVRLRRLHLHVTPTLTDKKFAVLFENHKSNDLRDHLVDLYVVGKELTLTGFAALWSVDGGVVRRSFCSLRFLTIVADAAAEPAECKIFVSALRDAFLGGPRLFALPSLLRVDLLKGVNEEATVLTQFSSKGYQQWQEIYQIVDAAEAKLWLT
eukprot:TRINITY_DN8343_c0_g2_i1.p1 TRINITY_DN8343_c0_g2~~TRINITY_DN8343_c0_g2_i1.p1  ORF type:complete len:243 (+),score=43.19 TRINITY_DN8343_c0_g2_i1:29-730(+)